MRKEQGEAAVMQDKLLPSECHVASSDKGMPDQLIGVNQIAEMLSISKDFVRKLDRTGEMPKSLKLGRRRLWKESEIEEWIARKLESRK